MRGWFSFGSGGGGERTITLDGPILYPYEPYGAPMAIPDEFVDEYDDIRKRPGGGPYVTKAYPLGRVSVTPYKSNAWDPRLRVLAIDGFEFDDTRSHYVGQDIRNLYTSIQPAKGVEIYPNKIATPCSVENTIVAYNKGNGYACFEADYFIVGFARGLNTEVEGEVMIGMPTNQNVKSAFSGVITSGTKIMRQNNHYAQTGGGVSELVSMSDTTIRGITLGRAWGNVTIAYMQNGKLHEDRLYAHTTPTKGSFIMRVNIPTAYSNFSSSVLVEVSNTEKAPTEGSNVQTRGVMYRGEYPSTLSIFQHVSTTGVVYLGYSLPMGIGGMNVNQTAAGFDYGLAVYAVPKGMEYPNLSLYPDWNNKATP